MKLQCSGSRSLDGVLLWQHVIVIDTPATLLDNVINNKFTSGNIVYIFLNGTFIKGIYHSVCLLTFLFFVGISNRAHLHLPWLQHSFNKASDRFVKVL